MNNNKEVELKFKIDNKSEFQKIIKSNFIKEQDKKITNSDFYAVYFDTEDKILFDNKIVFRIRREGKKLIATIKWNDESIQESGFYERNEENFKLKSSASLLSPDINEIRGSDIGNSVINLIGEKKLLRLFEVEFKRTELRVDFKESVFCISYDNGKIFKENNHTKISEMEVEIISGTNDDLKEFGHLLEENFKLKPEEKSKYERGLGL